MNIKLEIYDLIKLRDGRIGLIRDEYTEKREWKTHIYLQTGTETVSKKIPLVEYSLDSFSYNNCSVENKGNDPNDIIAIFKGGSEYGYMYFQYGMEYFLAHEPKWNWKEQTPEINKPEEKRTGLFLEKHDIVKLRNGDMGLIKDKEGKDGQNEPCVLLFKKEKGGKSTTVEIPLDDYFLGSFFYNSHSSEDKGKDPRDIVAIKKGDDVVAFLYYHYGMGYFQQEDKDGELEYDWVTSQVTKDNIVLGPWDMVKLRNGDVGIIQYDIEVYIGNTDYPKSYDNPGFKIFVQKDAENSYELSADMYWGVEAYRDEVRCEEYDIIAYRKNVEKFPHLIRDYFRGGTKKIEEDYCMAYDWEDEAA